MNILEMSYTILGSRCLIYVGAKGVIWPAIRIAPAETTRRPSCPSVSCISHVLTAGVLPLCCVGSRECLVHVDPCFISEKRKLTIAKLFKGDPQSQWCIKQVKDDPFLRGLRRATQLRCWMDSASSGSRRLFMNTGFLWLRNADFGAV